jgi:hypothetical protein
MDGTPAGESPAAGNLSFAFDLPDILPDTGAARAESDVPATKTDIVWPSLRIANVPEIPPPAFPPVPIDDDPVLIIEDDAPVPAPAKSLVRRHEYQNLFSRLRSG